MFHSVTVVGVGLISGSFCLAIRERRLVDRVIGVDISDGHLNKAKQLGLIDESASLAQAVRKSELVFVAIPVDASIPVVREILDIIDNDQIVMDAGSTKQELCTGVRGHPMRKRFVATHPMWGTENSGPESAVKRAFTGRAAVICEREMSDASAISIVEDVYRQLGMRPIYMDAQDHDIHAAHVSHISHLSSFALANTVLEKERSVENIFELASGGFESSVRLAKSHAEMWVPIFMQNRKNVLEVLNEQINQLYKFRTCLEQGDCQRLAELIGKANKIRRILSSHDVPRYATI